MSRFQRAAGVLAVLALHALGAYLDATDSASPRPPGRRPSRCPAPTPIR
jgi:hypothetical protein